VTKPAANRTREHGIARRSLSRVRGITRGATIRAVRVVKKSVSLDADVAAMIQAAADEDGVSFSTWLSAAAEQVALIRTGLKAVAEWENDPANPRGPLTGEEKDWGRREVAWLMGWTDERPTRPAAWSHEEPAR
jgi:hypothetical protein